jgi:glycosyltransferase involved in cell wall biosynthesis
MANGIEEHQIALIKQALPLENEPAYCAVEKAKTTDSVRLVFLGRVQPQKALHLLLEVLKQFSENEFRLDVFAREEDTDYYQSCKKMAKDMPLVNWNGLLPRKDVISVLSQFDMLVLPSAFSEMSPLVIQEAFAARLPVLASKVYGNMEQVKDGETGLLFDFENKDSLKNKLQLILQSPQLLIKFRKNIYQPRPFSQLKEQYHQLYLL